MWLVSACFITYILFHLTEIYPDSYDKDNIMPDYNTRTNMYEPNSRNPYHVNPSGEEDQDNMSDNFDEGPQGARNGTVKEVSSEDDGIGVWTLYIIVGAVAGGVLLAGLVAIAIALCCQREEDPQYKSTSV